MAERRRITSVSKNDSLNAYDRIGEIAGVDWKHTLNEAISYIKSGTYEYYVKPSDRIIDIVISTDQGNEYLKGQEDDLQPDTLLRLRRLLSYDELLMQFENQVRFLVNSCNAFDQGSLEEAIRLAVTLRILLYDYKQSRSLLGQLGKKETFINTAFEPEHTDEIAIVGKTSKLKLVSSLIGNQIHRYRPNFGTTKDHPRVNFEEWWNQIVITDMEGSEFSRAKIVMSIADQDGGAHVDPALEEDYYKLTRLNSVQHFIQENVTTMPENIQMSELTAISSPAVVFHTIRQIAHEVIISKIDPERSRMSDSATNVYPYNEDLYSGGPAFTILGLYK